MFQHLRTPPPFHTTDQLPLCLPTAASDSRQHDQLRPAHELGKKIHPGYDCLCADGLLQGWTNDIYRPATGGQQTGVVVVRHSSPPNSSGLEFRRGAGSLPVDELLEFSIFAMSDFRRRPGRFDTRLDRPSVRSRLGREPAKTRRRILSRRINRQPPGRRARFVLATHQVP